MWDSCEIQSHFGHDENTEQHQGVQRTLKNKDIYKEKEAIYLSIFFEKKKRKKRADRDRDTNQKKISLIAVHKKRPNLFSFSKFPQFDVSLKVGSFWGNWGCFVCFVCFGVALPFFTLILVFWFFFFSRKQQIWVFAFFYRKQQNCVLAWFCVLVVFSPKKNKIWVFWRGFAFFTENSKIWVFWCGFAFFCSDLSVLVVFFTEKNKITIFWGHWSHFTQSRPTSPDPPTHPTESRPNPDPIPTQSRPNPDPTPTHFLRELHFFASAAFSWKKKMSFLVFFFSEK